MRFSVVMIGQSTPLPLFVYGTLLSDQPAFYLIAAHVVKSAPATVLGLTLHDAGHYPIAVPGADHITGEVHWLRTAGYAALIKKLDIYEGAEYTRQRYQALLTADRQLVDVWVFVGILKHGKCFPLIADGNWRNWLNQNSR